MNNNDKDSALFRALLGISQAKAQSAPSADFFYKALLATKQPPKPEYSALSQILGQDPSPNIRPQGFSIADILSAPSQTNQPLAFSALANLLSQTASKSSFLPSDVKISNSLKSELESEVADIFKYRWEERNGNVVPDEDSLSLHNEAVKLEATVLYADLADSTKLVDGHIPSFAAEVYKSFLRCAAKVLNSEEAEITAYDGDRIMAVFRGDRKNTRAVRSAMKIKHTVDRIINPRLRYQYGQNAYEIKHVIGIDTSSLFVAKAGVRLANDLVWVGRAANYAAKLCALPHSHSTYITKEVYDVINDSVKMSYDGRSMWEPMRWNTFDDRIIYRSTWGYSL